MEKQQPIVEWTWREKYRWTRPDGTSDEHSILDTHKRVVSGVYAQDVLAHAESAKAIKLMDEQIWCPAGRIHAGAGTDSRVTLINCYVSPDIEDSMRTTNKNKHSKGIGDALNVALFTQQMGGGIGMNFSTLRPYGAIVKRTNSVSTGPLPFMDMWNAMCATIKSAGARRGAMMGVLRCDHPDIFKFIKAKRTAGRLTNFNVSVLVSDAFMDAVANDASWDLVFRVPPAGATESQRVTKSLVTGEDVYVYETIRARDLWEDIMQHTYEYAEPGIIFIDRVNEWNNLYYCEDISATNPCGEQPLPADGACNLAAQNLARLILDPFGRNPALMLDLLRTSVRVGMRFLDNVLDISQYPTEEQREEGMAKRRTGMGITGLANALQQLKIRYGSDDAVETTGLIMRTIRDEAYRASIDLSKERGPFLAYDREKYLKGKFIQTLPEDIQQGIAEHGIRNSVLLTIAPTGTTSLYYGNVSSGLEPTFAWKYQRKVLEQDGSFNQFEDVYDYGYLKFKEITGYEEGGPLMMPDYMVSAMELPVEAHLKMQAVCQKYVDASISKTINVPRDIPYEDFKNVYAMAYSSGCKGCTTYRPSGVRGSVMSVEEKTEVVVPAPQVTVAARPKELEGTTYKVKYPGLDHAFYVTVNDYIDDSGNKMPFEIFINSKSVKHQEWIAALTRMVSAIFRRGGDVTFIIEELKQVHSSQGGAFIGKKYVPSLVAFLADVIEKHFVKIGLIPSDDPEPVAAPVVPEEIKTLSGHTLGTVYTGKEQAIGAECPQCEAPTLTKQEGCAKCSSCGYSECG